MKKTIIIISLLITWGYIKSNKYKVVSVTDKIVIVNRQGKLLKFYDPTGYTQVNDSIRLFYDYDTNYKSLTINH